jgi:hypothetical protein
VNPLTPLIIQTAVRFGLVYPVGALSTLVKACAVIAKRNDIRHAGLQIEDGVDLPAAKGFADE